MDKANKKIIFVITKSNFGGAQRYVLDLATEFKAKGYDVKVAMGGTGLLYNKLQSKNIDVIEIPNMQRDISIKKEILSAIFLYKLFKKEKPDIVHLNSSKAGGLGALSGRLARVPKIIFTLHGLAINENRRRIEKIIIKILYLITIKLSHNTIAVSHALKEQVLKSIPLIKNKVFVIHNGIDTADFQNKHEARLKLIDTISLTNSNPISDHASLIIGTIGELHPIKGQKYLIEGFKKALERSSVSLYLFIIGDGQEKARLSEQIKTLGMEENIFLCGHIDNASKILKAFDIFILPSLSEGLPYVLEEAGLANIPVIATNVGGVPEIIQNDKNGLIINPKSSTDISESILLLTFNPNKRDSLAKEIELTIKNKFSIKNMISETEKIYNPVI
jgi:glycosyltransferase involved in cell wall biosynthesis